MPLFVVLVALLTAACASTAPAAKTSEGVKSATNWTDLSPAAAPAVAEPAADAEEASAPDSALAAEEGGEPEYDPDEAAGGEEAGEGESHEVDTGPARLRYTADLSDEDLARTWSDEPAVLGSMSVGFVDAGRLVNGVQFPRGEAWTVVSPEKAWGTAETVASIQAAIRAVRAQYPGAPLLRVNQISARDGGYLRPHQSHQNGRDADLAFYYPTEAPVRARAREKVIDLALNWALVKALATQTDVQMILVDRRVQKRLIEYADAHGEDPSWVDSLFRGRDPLVKHARGHRDHFHVRFFNPRAQELGRRVVPLLSKQPEFNVAMHRVRRGDSLGEIARKYGTTAALIRKANHLKGNAIRAGITLTVPSRGPCTRCAVPPPMVLPPRRLPPSRMTAAAEARPLARTPGAPQ